VTTAVRPLSVSNVEASKHSQLASPGDRGADLTADLTKHCPRTSAVCQIDAQLDVFVDAMEARIAGFDATAASAVNPVERAAICAADVIVVECGPPVPGKVYEW
jgi:hypothetical protein